MISKPIYFLKKYIIFLITYQETYKVMTYEPFELKVKNIMILS